jgi:HAD superfamily hydrolase (TIGR01509 family)
VKGPHSVDLRRALVAIEAVLFDLDGTLLDSRVQQWQSLIRALADSGLPVPEESMASRVRGVSLDESMGILGVPDVHLNAVRENTTRWTHRLSGSVRAFPGTASVLKRLRDLGYRLGIVTNRLRSDLPGDGPVRCLLSLADVTVCTDDVGQPKPHPAPLLYAIHVISGTPERTLYVGDTAIDVEAGCRAGCWTVLVRRDHPGEAHVDTFAPHLAVTSLDEIVKLLVEPGAPRP